jgi:leucyl/phenylalanyl-tRNA--protein transferase
VALLTYLEPGDDFPPSANALEEPNGLLAAGGCLDSATLLRAYSRGIFPWYEAPQPILWWTPDPRSVLFPAEIHVSRSLRRSLRRSGFRLARDRDFAAVVRACAAPREGQRGTWIDNAMQRAYKRLHDEGWAHSIEVYDGDELVGGLYGVRLGGAFFGESMFSLRSDASKIALVALARGLAARPGAFIDCQIESEHLNSLGARNLSRLDFEQRLAHTRHETGPPLAIPASCEELA